MYNGRGTDRPECALAGAAAPTGFGRLEDVMTVVQVARSRGAVAASLGILLSVATLGEAKLAMAQQRPLKKVDIVVATPVLNVTYSQLTLPVTLGYWRDEGYDVKLHTADGSLQAVQQLVGGNAEFAAASANAIILANVKSSQPLRVAMNFQTSDFALAVEESSSIKSVKDLKGATIGVVNLATGAIVSLNGLLHQNGMDPTRDIQYVPTGFGATAVQAIKSGRVQGLIYWGTAIAGFENAGLKLRKIVGEDWNTYPEYTLAIMRNTAEKNPEMAVAISRGAIKGMIFTRANPECAVKLHWAKYPSTKPGGMDDATALRSELNLLSAQRQAWDNARKLYGGDKLWGNFDLAGWDRLVRFMAESKQIDKTVPADVFALSAPDHYKKINDFDPDAIEASAKACKV
jgi:NitT/TauT family transport system substrate-binding protein